MMRMRYHWLGLLLAAACARGESQHAAVPFDSARPWRKPGDKIDSILPMPEYLRRFREGLIAPVGFEGGAATREALARRFLTALAARDTAAIGGLLVSRAEFGWLVFPAHLYARPPYELDPAIFWMQLGGASRKGLQRALAGYGGKRLSFLALHCQRDTLQLKEGPGRLWSPCTVRYRAGDSVVTHRLFGSIVERNGRAKLLSLANDF